MNGVSTIAAVKDFVFECAYGFRGIPVRIGTDVLRMDASLRGWIANSEREFWAVMDAKLGDGDVVFDIGANFGLLTVTAARRVAPYGRVYAFEPVPANLRLLRRNIALNGLSNCVLVISKAVSDSSNPTLEFFVPNDGVSITAGLRSPDGSTRRIRVPNVRLDDFSFESHDRLRLVKIDVEGAEVDVIKGATTLLRRLRPILLIEVHGFALPSFGSSVQEYRELVASLGYKERRLPSPNDRGDEFYQAICEPN